MTITHKTNLKISWREIWFLTSDFFLYQHTCHHSHMKHMTIFLKISALGNINYQLFAWASLKIQPHWCCIRIKCHLVCPLKTIPALDCLKTETTCFRKLVSCSALLMLGFLAETSSWFQRGPRFLKTEDSDILFLELTSATRSYLSRFCLYTQEGQWLN